MSSTTNEDSYNQHAEAWADRLRSGNNVAHYLLEKPAMRGLLPDLEGKRILCIGCGSGEECELLEAAGASKIHGIDTSKALIDLASTSYPRHSFEVRAMEDLAPIAAESYDYVYSSLTLHYSDNWRPILGEVRRILRPGGVMLFSTHHPVKWGSHVARGAEQDSFTMGYVRPKTGEPAVQGDYLNSRKIEDLWFGNMRVEYFHRSMQEMLGDVIASGLKLRRFVEPSPVPSAKTENPAFWAIHSRIPLFLIMELARD